jgi:hypothetical protein
MEKVEIEKNAKKEHGFFLGRQQGYISAKYSVSRNISVENIQSVGIFQYNIQSAGILQHEILS